MRVFIVMCLLTAIEHNLRHPPGTLKNKVGFVIYTSEGPLKDETMFSAYRKERALKSRHKSMLPFVTQIAAQTKYQLQVFGSGRAREAEEIFK